MQYVCFWIYYTVYMLSVKLGNNHNQIFSSCCSIRTVYHSITCYTATTTVPIV